MKKLNNAREVRKAVLNNLTPQLIETVTKAVKEVSVADSLSTSQLEVIKTTWPTIQHITTMQSDTVKINAQNSQEVIQAVCRGKITLAEATKLMALLHTQFEMEELPKLIAQIEKLEQE